VGFATEIKAILEICRENMPVSQQHREKTQKSLEDNKIHCIFAMSIQRHDIWH
jgi:hypothetical protein